MFYVDSIEMVVMVVAEKNYNETHSKDFISILMGSLLFLIGTPNELVHSGILDAYIASTVTIKNVIPFYFN